MARKKVKKSVGLSNPQTRVSLTITPNSKSTLDKIASETGLSKSALFEGILNGSISLSSQSAQKSIALSKENNGQSPEVSINQGDGHDSNDLIKQEIAREKAKIANLEKQISAKNKQEHSLHDQLQSQQNQIEQLQTRLKNLSQPQASDLSKELANKDQEIKQLNQRLGQQQQQIEELADKDSQIKQLNQLINEQKQLINRLQQQQQNTPVVNQIQSNPDLSRINQQHEETIKRLTNRISELEAVSSIGNQVLNKWRSKSFR